MPPKSINSLMIHLRESGVAISGTSQKLKLRNIGYFHAYKGYRFVGSSKNMLEVSSFNEIVALYDLDAQLKSLFYSPLMAIETALKNRALEQVLKSTKSERFEVIYRKSLRAHECCPKADLNTAWLRRLKLRTNVYNLIAQYHDSKAVIRHFRNKDSEVPIWALFEIFTLGNFGAFYSCLHDDIKEQICLDLNLEQSNSDAKKILGKMIFVLKDLRNAVAHNGVIVDVRFRSGKIPKALGYWLQNDINVGDIWFKEITDYALLVCYLMAKLGFTKTECKQFLKGYQGVLEKYRKILPYNIFAKFFSTQTRSKIDAAKIFAQKL